MTARDNHFRVRPGGINHGNHIAISSKTLVGEAMRANRRTGLTGKAFGKVDDSHDNALAETIGGLYKPEVNYRRGPWHNFEAVE